MLKKLAKALILYLVVGVGAHAQNPYTSTSKPRLDVTAYGAKGDGITDNYNALRAAADAINKNGGGTLYFPPGVYSINRYRTGSNGVRNIVFQNCDQLFIEGVGAKIEVRGNFHRTADISSIESSYNTVVPLQFINCRNFTVRGLELDGNNEVMTRPSSVIEGPSHGIITSQCSYYTIRDVYVHHFAGDGVYLGDHATRSDRYALLDNVTARYNSRDGISVIHLRTGQVQNSVFESNGLQVGTYGPHAPYSGVNIEPKSSSTLDYKTGALTFTNCQIRSNGNSQIQVSGTDKDNITFRACTIEQGTSRYINTVNFAVINGLIENCVLDVQQIVPSWEKYPGTSVTLRNNTIRSNYRAITDYISSGSRTVVIEGNQIIGTHTAPATTQMPYLRNPGTIYRNNTLIIPKAAKNSSTAQPIARLNYIARSEGNTFQTDYVTSGSAHFYTDYTGTSTVVGDLYPTEKHLRRAANAGYNTTNPVATQLAFLTQPGAGVAGSALNVQPVVVARTSTGATAQSFTGPVTIAIQSGTGASGASLSGTRTVNAVNGIATFTNLSINAAGTGYRLTATSGSLSAATSNAFNITAPSTPPPSTTAYSVKFIRQPGGATAGQAFTTQPQLIVRRSDSKTDTTFNGPLTVTIRPGTGTSGAVLTGTTTVNAVNGIATFTNLGISLAGSGYQLITTNSTLNVYPSSSFNVAAGSTTPPPSTTAYSVKFIRQPGGATAGQAFTTQPQLIVRRSDSKTDTTFNGPLTVTIRPGTGASGAVLTGTTTVNAVNGIATFTNLGISLAGSGYQLITTNSTLNVYPSSSFNVAAGSTTPPSSSSAYSVKFIRQPAGAAVGRAFTTQPQLIVRRADSHTDTTFNGPLTVMIRPGTGTAGAALTGTTTVNASRGIATFTNLAINRAGSGYQLIPVNSNLNVYPSAPFNVN